VLAASCSCCWMHCRYDTVAEREVAIKLIDLEDM
jgi:hypothetical protein